MKFKPGYILLGILLVYCISWLTGTRYIWKTLVYQKVDYDDYKIFHNRGIKKGVPYYFPASTSTIDCPPDLKKYLTEIESIGLLVLRNDSVAYENYWDGYDETTIANSFSVAKSYVSMMVGIAIEDGYIESTEQSVREFLPDLDSATFHAITLGHLLTMSSGLEWIERYNMPINHTTESYYGTNLWKLVSRLKRKHPPGEVYHYKGCDPQLLAFVLAEATGTNISSYLSTRFWKPTGSESGALWSLDHKNGTEKAYCCINAVARDFARIGQVYLHHGKWNDAQLVDSLWVAKSVRAHKIPDRSGDPVDYYGYQWWTMEDIGKNVFYCRGLNGQYVIVMPDQKAVIVRTGHKREKAGENHPVEVLRMVEWIETL